MVWWQRTTIHIFPILSNMKQFITKITLIILPIFIFIVVWLFIYGPPPPKLSTSISFNAKMKNIKDKQLGKKIDILAIGSSMSLNNIHTCLLYTSPSPRDA